MAKNNLLLALVVFSFILIGGCVPEEEKLSKGLAEGIEKVEVPGTPTSQGLGNLCSGEAECHDFCHNNRGQCENYCAENGIEYCFPEDGTTANENKRGEPNYNYNYFEDVSHLPPCGDKKEFFTTPPLALDDFTTITPLGLLSPTSHTFPAPHLYFKIKREGSSFESPVAKVPLYAPGNITITRIDLVQATNRPEFADDSAVIFAFCSEFKAYFDHVIDLAPKLKQAYDSASADRCDEYTVTYKTGPVNWKKCNKVVNIKVSEGELIGYAGGGAGQSGLDLGTYDSRIEPNRYANPKRVFRPELAYNVCPLDYFSQSISELYRPRLGAPSYSGKVVTSLTCGKVIHDVPGTAKGNWFAFGIDTARIGHEQPHLALVQDHVEQDLQVFSNGDSTKNSGLDFGLYYFKPLDSGLVNRDFSQVKPDGNVYCYDTKSDYKNNEPKTIIIQLTDPETLKIEGKEATSCSSGHWAFNNPTEFER